MFSIDLWGSISGQTAFAHLKTAQQFGFEALGCQSWQGKPF